MVYRWLSGWREYEGLNECAGNEKGYIRRDCLQKRVCPDNAHSLMTSVGALIYRRIGIDEGCRHWEALSFEEIMCYWCSWWKVHASDLCRQWYSKALPIMKTRNVISRWNRVQTAIRRCVPNSCAAKIMIIYSKVKLKSFSYYNHIFKISKEGFRR